MIFQTRLSILMQLAFLSLIAFATAAHAQSSTKPLIPEVNVLRGDFVQIRSLKGFKNPLRSEGRFLISKTNGVVWQTLKPFPSQIVVSNSGKVVNLGKSQNSQKQDGKKPNPVMNKIMQAMISGNQAELAKYFKIQRSEQNGVWNLALEPKGGMARMFTHVEVKGERYVRQVIMQEKNGDKTELNFFAVSDIPGTLSAEEKKYFQ